MLARCQCSASSPCNLSATQKVQGQDEEFTTILGCPDSHDCSSLTVRARPVSVLRNHLRGVNGGRGGGRSLGLKPIKARLISTVRTDASSAATALGLAAAIAFDASTFAEHTSFANLFDEARILGVTCKYLPVVTTAASAGANFSTGSVGIELDTLAVAPTTQESVLSGAYSHGPMFTACAVNGVQAGFSPSTRDFMDLRMKMPNSIGILQSTDAPGSQWFALDSGTAPNIFLWRAFFNALGTTGVVTLYSIFFVEVEFRLRT